MDTTRLAALEALADPRLGPVSQEELATELATHGLVLHRNEVDSRDDATQGLELDEGRRGRALEWATLTLTQGEVLDAFAAHCRDELDDVTVLEQGLARLELAWRRERSTLELRAGLLFLERLAGETPLLLLVELTAAAVERFLDDATLRARICVYDLDRLEKAGAVRSSAFVYFEWFLRDAYGVKVVPAAAFTQGLVDRGIISLGMG